MLFRIAGKNYESDHCAIMHYTNDILDGLYIDMEDDYAFITQHEPGHHVALIKASDNGVEHFFQSGEIDYDEPPH